MKPKKLAVAFTILSLLVVSYFVFSDTSEETVALTSTVKKEDFKSEIVISGELQSTSNTNIGIPSGLRRHRIYRIKVQHLIPEGTYVKKGDYIGKLDPEGINDKILDAESNITKEQSSYIQQQIDTTLTLKKERNAIKDLIFSVEEKKIELEQSKYESPSVIRQLEISLQKLERNLKQKQDDYGIIEKKEQQKMIRVTTNLNRLKKNHKNLVELQKQLTIYSESSGMLTYTKSWDGIIKTGSEINTYGTAAIAILPDLSKMESKTFANEVDVRKIKKGMKVRIGFDAFPEMEMEGEVTSVANIGEKKQGSDIKLFQVLIRLNKTNKNIRPGMTTSNSILSLEQKDVLTTPLESIFSKDSITYVYRKNGMSITKLEVALGASNNDYVIVEKGLKENDVVYLNKPEGQENETIQRLE